MYTAKMKRPFGEPPLNLARLRTSWLVHHLTIGTRLPELAAASGSRCSLLFDLYRYVPQMNSVEVAKMLRGDDV